MAMEADGGLQTWQVAMVLGNYGSSSKGTWHAEGPKWGHGVKKPRARAWRMVLKNLGRAGV